MADKYFDKKYAIHKKNGFQFAEEVHKLIIIKFKKPKVYSYLKITFGVQI